MKILDRTKIVLLQKTEVVLHHQQYDSKQIVSPTGNCLPIWGRILVLDLQILGWFRVTKKLLKKQKLANLCPHGESNPGFGLERAASWAARRWGLAALEFYHAPVANVNYIER